jgi:5-methylcytosine-specific restriction endonuclease McrA
MSKRERDYAKEYREYHSRPEQIANRSDRNKARRMMEKEGKVRKGDGMEVDHKRMIKDGGSNARSNLRVIPMRRNRGWADGKT